MEQRFVHYGEVYIGNDAFDGVFDVSVDTHAAEPFSWGQGRGTDTEALARLRSLDHDGVTLTRDDAVRLTGAAHVERQERLLAEVIAEGETV